MNQLKTQGERLETVIEESESRLDEAQGDAWDSGELRDCSKASSKAPMAV